MAYQVQTRTVKDQLQEVEEDQEGRRQMSLAKRNPRINFSTEEQDGEDEEDLARRSVVDGHICTSAWEEEIFYQWTTVEFQLLPAQQSNSLGESSSGIPPGKCPNGPNCGMKGGNTN